MELTPIQLKIAKVALFVAPVVLALNIGLMLGNAQGAAGVTAQWESAKNEQLKKIIALKDELARKGEAHRQETTRISDQLRKTEADYETTVAALATERSERLRLSDQRAARYLERAEAGTAECRSLASHTAQLDRALEEGRSLVKELGSTIERRDSELRLLGAQIQNDRKLLGEK